jgi:hypothetical protein
MNRIVPAISLVCFLFGGPGLAWAGGGGVAADRLRDPNGRGIAMDVK